MFPEGKLSIEKNKEGIVNNWIKKTYRYPGKVNTHKL